MKKATAYMAILLSAVMMVSACGQSNSTDTQASSGANASQTSSESAAQSVAQTTQYQSTEAQADMRDDSKEATGDFMITSSSAGASVEIDESTYTIKAAGEYVLTGSLSEGQIIVDAGDDDEVRLLLSGTSITCSTGAAILVLNADKVDIESVKGSYNVVNDLRPAAAESAATAAEEEDAGESTEELNDNAAIYSLCDTKITGSGTLVVNSENYHGIKTKDDLSVKDVQLQVTSSGNALRGNDSLTIKSGNLILVSTASDGIKTSNSDVSSKGNQRGTITISGGQIDIYAACDGISAAYDVEISDSDACSVNIYTSAYADEAGSGATVTSDIYLIVPSSLYNESTAFYAYFYNDDETAGKWAQCTYDTMVYSGRTAYYGLLVKVPEGYDNILFNTVAAGTTPDGSNYDASSGGETINDSLNGYLISGISSGSIVGDWVQLSSGSGSTSKTTYSSKGIKAANQIVVTGGTVSIYSMDDAIHANGGDALENGSTGLGNFLMSGGSIFITAADDAIHADSELTITGGYVKIEDSHEGLEGNVITVSGGEVYVYGEDDGINAAKGAQTPLVNVTGGYLEVTTPSGDTDAIDSNGNVTVSGGFVLIKGGSAAGGMAGSIDADGSVVVSAGSVVALGGITSTPASGSVNTYITSGTGFAAGEYILKDGDGNTVLSFTLDGSYTSGWIASEGLELNGSYTLTRDGSEVASWTQSSSTVGSAGTAGNMGGFGGRGGR